MALVNTHSVKMGRRKLSVRPFFPFTSVSVLMVLWGIAVLFASKTTRRRDDVPIIKRSLSSTIKPAFDFDPNMVPDWMRDYMIWHGQQLLQINADNWKHKKYILARCLDTDSACGGISDRLKSLPTLLLLAFQSKRILLIHWTRPAAIEEFLVPNALNFTKPAFLPAKGLGTRLYSKLAPLVKAVKGNSTVPILCTRLQDQHGGSEFFNRHTTNQNQTQAFRTLFRHLFGSVFSMSERVQRKLPHLPKHFVAAHLRTNYGNHPLPTEKVPLFAQNAVRCAKNLRPEHLPVVFVSDSSDAVQSVKNVALVTDFQTPLHLDKDVGEVSEYTSIFVDLWTLSQATCVAHGKGGFGRLGLLLSRDPSCFFKFFDKSQYFDCP